MALSAIGIKKAGDGRLGDGGGLEIHKKGESGKWVWRYSFAGKRRQMGLGSWPVVSLSDARKERDKWALALSQGKDPITERQAQKAEALAEMQRVDPTLEALAADVLEARKATLRRGGVAARWMSPLEIHVFPKIGKKPVSEIHQADIKAALSGIWRTKHPTAEKAIQRLRIIFKQGKLMGFDCDPFTVEAAQHMLGHVAHEATPIEATPWQEIPELFEWLTNKGTSAACLQLMILTAVRGASARGARFEEIDGDIWTIPPDRMKGKVGVKEFRVPLSPQAMQIVEDRRALGGEFLFTGHRGRPITDTSLSKFMKENNLTGRPHGFRTSFRSWVQDTDACGYDVAETILAHTIGNKVERSYARSDILDRRRPVMETWARYVTKAEDNVVSLRG